MKEKKTGRGKNFPRFEREGGEAPEKKKGGRALPLGGGAFL